MSPTDPVFAFQALTPDQMLDAVDSKFLAEKSQKCDGRFLALNSYENRVYRIGVEDEENIVAKFYRPQRWSDESIIEEHRFTQSLANLEIPVVPPLQDNSKQTLFHHAPFRFSIYPCCGGRELEVDNPEHLKQIGRFIGRIHATGATERYRNRPEVDIESYVVQPRKFLLGNNFIPAHIVEAYSTLTKMLAQQIQNCFDRAGEIANIRLHGDFHPSNVLWTDDGPHIVDFDDARTGPAIQDFWMFLSGDRDYMTARLNELLQGYIQFFEFNPAELNLIEALRTMRMIHYAGWLAKRWKDPSFPIAFPWFNAMEYWEDHILGLREQSALMDEEPLQWINIGMS